MNSTDFVVSSSPLLCPLREFIDNGQTNLNNYHALIESPGDESIASRIFPYESSRRLLSGIDERRVISAAVVARVANEDRTKYVQ